MNGQCRKQNRIKYIDTIAFLIFIQGKFLLDFSKFSQDAYSERDDRVFTVGREWFNKNYQTPLKRIHIEGPSKGERVLLRGKGNSSKLA